MNIAEKSNAITPDAAHDAWKANVQATYHASRREWLDRNGDSLQQARNWKWVACLALIVGGLAVGALIELGMQSQVVPYVVRVDKSGTILGVERADRAERPDNTMIVAQLARWVKAVRTVYVDAAAQRTLVNEAYAMINRLGDAYGLLNDHMRLNDPFQRARTETVSIAVQTVLPIAGSTWQVEWQETTHGRDGGQISSYQYQATITISFSPAKDEATVLANPLGLYINAYNWARRL